MECKNMMYDYICEKPLCNCGDTPTPTPETGNDTDLRAVNMTVLPSTVRGDFIINTAWLPSATCRVGDNYYVICAPRDSDARESHSNAGLVYAFNRVTNRIIDGFPKTVVVGHANGLCFDENRNKFIIAPVFDYSGETRVNWNALIEYDLYFDNYTSINTPENIMSVSFDGVTKTVYAYAYSKKIYKYDDIFTLHTNVVFNYEYTYSINQGFAVCSPYFYLSSPYGNILIGTLKDGNVFTEKCVSQTDYDEIYSLGELEDFEFYKNTAGEYFLYAVRYNKIQSDIYDAFVTQIYYNRLNPTPAYGVHTSSDIDYTMRISDDTVQNFHNKVGYIKHPAQLNVLSQTSNAHSLEINCNTDFGNIVLGNNTNIIINGVFKFSSITIHTGVLSLYFKDVSDVTLTGGTDFIKIDRGANFKIVGSANANFNTTNNHIAITFGYYKPLIMLRLTPKVNGVNATKDNQLFYIGSAYNYNRFYGVFFGSERLVIEGE